MALAILKMYAKMANKKVFGERNQKLSYKLLSENEYYDWVITTAFYSSIHFFENKILPAIINGCSCKNISDVKRAYHEDGRHAARRSMIRNHCPSDISGFYNWLDDQSRNSRYTTYKVNKPMGEKAKDYLDKIYLFCYPPASVGEKTQETTSCDQ